jgi:PAP2 superfamily
MPSLRGGSARWLRGRSGRGRCERSGRRELALFGAIYLIYDAARWIFAGHLATARRHARWVIHLERTLHIQIEGAVQHAVGTGFSGVLLSNIYLAAQLVVLPGALLWLYYRNRTVYRSLRNTVAGAWLISTPIFALYPTAPPRLAGIGIKDMVSAQAGVALTGHSTMFYNPYAAVPSLHVGLAFAIGTALAAAALHRWSKGLLLMWGPVVTLAVVATGNHYLFDAATGLLTAAIAYGVTQNWTRVRGAIGRRAERSQLELISEPARS